MKACERVKEHAPLCHYHKYTVTHKQLHSTAN